jgi:hypothetical protein
MMIVSFILCFSHCGDVYSLDYLIAKRKKGEAFPSNRNILSKPWAQRLLQVQVAIVYWHSFINKATGAPWQNGTAVYMSTHMTDLIRFPIPAQFDTVLVSQLLTYYTLIVELSMFTLIWFKPFRYWVLLAGLLLHCGIEYTINLPGFEALMVATYINFIEPDDLNKVIDWLKWRWTSFSALSNGRRL